MTAELHCQGCNRRIGKRGRVIIVAGGTALCTPCSADANVHRRIFFQCRESGCVAANHQASTTTTRGRAKQLLDPQ